MRYGMPYMGSKNQIAKWVIDHLPKKEKLFVPKHQYQMYLDAMAVLS